MIFQCCLPPTPRSLKNLSIPNILKFHNNESLPRWSFTYCDGHLVGLFNMEIYFLQVDPLCWIISWVISSLPFFSLLSFHDLLFRYCNSTPFAHFFLFHFNFHFFPSNFWEITSRDLSSRPNIQMNYLGLFLNLSFIMFRRNKLNHKMFNWPSSSNLLWFSSWTIR